MEAGEHMVLNKLLEIISDSLLTSFSDVAAFLFGFRLRDAKPLSTAKQTSPMVMNMSLQKQCCAESIVP